MKFSLWIERPENLVRLKRAMKTAGRGEHPIVSDDRSLQAYYEILRDGGTDDWLARMFIHGAPGLRGTDGAFFEGMSDGLRSIEAGTSRTNQVASLFLHRAKQAGVSVAGKRYIGSIAEYSGDPNAWCDGRGEALRKLEAKERRRRAREEAEASAPKRMAADIVRDLVAEEMAANPCQRVEDAEERVRRRHGTPGQDPTPVLAKAGAKRGSTKKRRR